jgi:uncharacterized coiled-coil DUF342 family protein
MDSYSVTNEMLYELIHSFKDDVYRRFDTIDREFEKVNKEFEKVNKEFEKVHADIRDIRMELKDVRGDMKTVDSRLNEIYYDRERVRVHFTRGWAFASFLMSVFAVILTLAIDKAF